MDAATFLKARKTAVPEPVSEQESSAVVFRDTTPSGIVVEYSPSPRRLYRVGISDPNHPSAAQKVEMVEVPSVTSVLDSLAKDGLKFWGQDVGVRAVLELFKRGKLATVIDWNSDAQRLVHSGLAVKPGVDATLESLKELITAERLSCNHVLNNAADRGTNVHNALEQWARSNGEFAPTPQNFPEEERPYVEALLKWIDALNGNARPVLCEVMVGSVEYGFAGRYDLVLEVTAPVKLVQKNYKRKDDITITVQPGRYLVDAKTSKSVYPGSHFRQLAAYEIASVEGGYPPTQGQFVLHLDAEGRYAFVPSNASADDFLAVLKVYQSNQRLK